MKIIVELINGLIVNAGQPNQTGYFMTVRLEHRDGDFGLLFGPFETEETALAALPGAVAQIKQGAPA